MKSGLVGILLVAATAAAGEVQLKSGRTITAVERYEIQGAQVKITQEDGFVLYLPVERVDLGATAASWRPPAEQAPRSRVHVLRAAGAIEQAPEPAPLSVSENMRAYKAAHPEFEGGAFSAEATAEAAPATAADQEAQAVEPAPERAPRDQRGLRAAEWREQSTAAELRQKQATAAILASEAEYRAALATRSSTDIEAARQRLEAAKSELAAAEAELGDLKVTARQVGADPDWSPSDEQLTPVEITYYTQKEGQEDQ